MAGGAKTTEADAGKPAAKPQTRKPRATKPAAAVASAEPQPKGAEASVAETASSGVHGPACTNCGATLTGPFCAQCGQNAHLHNRLGDLLHELVEGVAHFDGRLWRTLPVLAFNPGRLSREWIDGRRVRYVAPLHVFLFAVFLLFLIPTLTGGHVLVREGGGEGRLRAPITLDFKDKARSPGPAGAEKAGQAALGELTKDSEYYANKIESLTYKLSFVVVPISMAILALLAIGRRANLYDHGVVSLYGLGFGLLVATLIALVFAVLGDRSAVAAVFARVAGLGLAVHAIWHLRQAYGFSWWGAIARGLALGLLSIIGYGAFLAGVTWLGLAG